MSQGAAAQKQGGKKPRTAITPTREDDFPQWYQSVIKAADLAENSPVRGCMVIKPYGFAIWENIQRNFDDIIKREGVDNAYFPLLIPLSFIAKEAEHVDGFATECAVVTHHRLEKDEDGNLAPASPLTEPMVVRPTSETIIGDAFSNWVQSYRDLPLKINQWANVMRWEMRPRMFLRTSEFLWQEGHNVFETPEEAEADARKMLECYREFLEEFLAIPVIPGEKTADERFPGAIATYTVEAILQDGKALQSATSHNLGQTFSRSSNIQFQNRDGEQALAWTTSWGMSTRTIGGLIMSHADDDGLVVPPKIAPYHVVILPIVKGDDDAGVMAFCDTLRKRLQDAGHRVKFDDTDARVPDKMWGWVKKGVPVRVEVGAREVEEGKVTCVRRDIGKASKETLSVDEFCDTLPGLLDKIQKALFDAAKERMAEQLRDMDDLEQVFEYYNDGGTGQVRIDTKLIELPEFEGICKEHALTPRCMPFADNGDKVVIGKSY